MDKTAPYLVVSFKVNDNIQTFTVNGNEDTYFVSNNMNSLIDVYKEVAGRYQHFIAIEAGIEGGVSGDIQNIYLLESETKVLIISDKKASTYDISDLANPILIEWTWIG